MGSCDVVPGRSDTLGVDRHSFSSFTFVSYIANRPIIIDRLDSIRMSILYYNSCYSMKKCSIPFWTVFINTPEFVSNPDILTSFLRISPSCKEGELVPGDILCFVEVVSCTLTLLDIMEFFGFCLLIFLDEI